MYFLRRLQDEISDQTPDSEWSSVLPESLANAWKAIRPHKDKAAKIAEKVLDMQERGAGQIFKLVLGQSPEHLYGRISQKMRDNGLHLVVLIDDLDRLEDQEIRDVAMLVKSVGNIENASYVLAYDPKRVCKGIKRSGRC